jgi:sulfide:quinone oxidoreductase
MTDPKRLSARVFVSPQVDPGKLEALASAGFRSIVCNRPDGEEAGQPSWDEVSQAAERAGMQSRHIPVVPGAIGDEHVVQFRAALDQLPAPVLAYCRTGGRAATLWALSQTGSLTPDEIVRTAASAGYDLSALADRLGSKSGA